MAGDWLKVEESTPDKPEIALLARKLGVSHGDAFLEWFRVYRWAGRTCPGFVPILSLADVDMLSGARPGTAAALASEDIGWLRYGSGGITFEKWDRHNGKSAKDRALEQEKKRKQRAEDAVLSPVMSRNCPEKLGTKSGPEREESERRVLSLNKGDRLAIGNGGASISQDATVTARRRSPRSPVDAFDSGGVDWELVSAWAERLGRKVKPRSVDDRRMWLRFAVLAQSFGEAWLVDGTEAVLQAKETRSTRQAHLVGVLKAKAAEEHGIDGDTFVAMLGRIEIPQAVWKSNVLEVK